MWKLVRVQSLNYLKYFLPLTAFLIYYFTVYDGGGKTPAFVFLCFWAFLLVSGSISTGEGYEEKHKGYRILSVLPLTGREIVGTKFLLVLGSVILATGLNVALLVLKAGSPGRTDLMVMIGVLWGVVCLIYGGIMYVGIFRFGFTSMTKMFWMVFLVLIVAMIFLLGDVIVPAFKGWAPAIREFAGSRWWLLVLVPAAPLYLFLYRVALRVKERGEAV